eukprot:919417-Rhodomonas_salina.3
MSLCARYAMSSTEMWVCRYQLKKLPAAIGNLTTLLKLSIENNQVHFASCLRACYAMSGTNFTDVATVSVHVCYAMSGTDIAYGATSCPNSRLRSGLAICLLAPYAKSGTDIAFCTTLAMRHPVRT